MKKFRPGSSTLLGIPAILALTLTGMIGPAAYSSEVPLEETDVAVEVVEQENLVFEEGEDALESEVSLEETTVPSEQVAEGATVQAPEASEPGIAASQAVVEEREPISISFPSGTTRLAGANRYETAAKVARYYPQDVEAVFVATGRTFPDALSAASAAATVGAPILLTSPSALPDTTRDALTYLSPRLIYIVGGTAAVNNSVQSALKQFAPVKRIGAANRYETSLEISKTVFDDQSSDFAVIATGG